MILREPAGKRALRIVIPHHPMGQRRQQVLPFLIYLRDLHNRDDIKFAGMTCLLQRAGGNGWSVELDLR